MNIFLFLIILSVAFVNLRSKGQERVLSGIKKRRNRFLLNWKEAHPDNGNNILNWHINRYAKNDNIKLSSSRAYHKNDNCFVEQRNSTHIRRSLGCLRFDTDKDQDTINDLLRHELRFL